MTVRRAELEDLEELLKIYNYEVENGTATLDITPQTYEQRRKWFDAHNSGSYVLLTAEADGKAVGYASLSPYREKEAYDVSAELSVYVSHNFRKRGIASELMRHIIETARKDSHLHTIVSVITSGNDASVALHRRFGFEYCGRISRAACKFDKYVDVMFYRLSV